MTQLLWNIWNEFSQTLERWWWHLFWQKILISLPIWAKWPFFLEAFFTPMAFLEHDTCDKKCTWFRTTIFIPCDKMSGKGDVSSASSVDLSRRDFRAMMYYDYCLGKSFHKCFQSLKHCFGDQSPSKGTVFRWFRQFLSGAWTLEDHDRCARMAKTVTPENVSRVEFLIKKDPKMAYAEIQDVMKISSGSLTRILRHYLGVEKRCALGCPITWVKSRSGVGWTGAPTC